MDRKYSACIIEDDVTTQRLILKYIVLRNEFGTIDRALNVKDAIVKLQEYNYDLVLINLNLENDSGFLVLETINNKPNIIFITDSRKYENHALTMGVVDYLIKPITKKRFNVALDCFLSRQ